ncbi:hypothetical protein ACRDNQ_04005 [Palleronia sp. KMU-117]|uniref:hypothetical protein n=1 Tax=Palleronia sp. KMU-117 TaxID=3434108 RepID=UPI003D74C033
MYLPEEIRDLIINRITTASTKQSSFYRAPASQYDSYPAYILEYGSNENQWASSASDRKTFMFNLYIAYEYKNDSEASRELAEVAISECIGELYRDVFQDPGVLNIPNGWARASDVSWGYGDGADVPIRMAMMQLEVTVHEDRA